MKVICDLPKLICNSLGKIRDWLLRRDDVSESFENISLDATIRIGQATLVISIVINGMAALGILNFIADAVHKQRSSLPIEYYAQASQFFSTGVLAAASAMASTYFAQGHFTNGLTIIGKIFSGIAMGLGLASLGYFYLGINLSSTSLIISQ